MISVMRKFPVLPVFLIVLLFGCGSVPVKRFYTLNYVPEPFEKRLSRAPYPVTIRIKEFDIEKAYDQKQMVYRKSAYELGRYYYSAWAVAPTDMVTDLVHSHLEEVNLVSHVVRRFDEGERPSYEIRGMIEAIEQYESDDLWFAHLALRIQLVRLSDGRPIYSRRFDNRKRVHTREPVQVVRELSRLADLVVTQAVHDMDVVLARDFGVAGEASPTVTESPEIDAFSNDNNE